MSAWVDQMFNAQQTATGGVVRRSVDDVMRYDALSEIIMRAQQSGWHVIETGDQIVVLCHPGSMQIFC